MDNPPQTEALARSRSPGRSWFRRGDADTKLTRHAQWPQLAQGVAALSGPSPDHHRAEFLGRLRSGDRATECARGRTAKAEPALASLGTPTLRVWQRSALFIPARVRNGCVPSGQPVDDKRVWEGGEGARHPSFLRQQLRNQLEQLDHVGALRPILFDTGEGGLVFREEVEFMPWQTYAIAEDGVERVVAYYSHWQLLYASDAVELGRVPVSMEWFLDEDRRRQVNQGYQHFYESQAERWRGLDDHWRECILLLVRLQYRYFPVIRGTLTKITTTLAYDPDVSDMVDPYPRTVRDFKSRHSARGARAHR